MGSTEIISSGPKRSTRSQVNLPARTLTILYAKIDQAKIEKEHLIDFQFRELLKDKYTNLVCVPVLHKSGSNTTNNILFMVINTSTEDLQLKRGGILGFLEQ